MPVEGVDLDVEPIEDVSSVPDIGVHTLEDGTYRYAPLEAGRYLVRATAAGVEPASMEATVYDHIDTVVEFDLEPA